MVFKKTSPKSALVDFFKWLKTTCYFDWVFTWTLPLSWLGLCSGDWAFTTIPAKLAYTLGLPHYRRIHAASSSALFLLGNADWVRKCSALLYKMAWFPRPLHQCLPNSQRVKTTGIYKYLQLIWSPDSGFLSYFCSSFFISKRNSQNL